MVVLGEPVGLIPDVLQQLAGGRISRIYMVGIQRISGKKPGKGGVMDYDFIPFSSALLRRFLIFENWI